jgi:hypothetical protein
MRGVDRNAPGCCQADDDLDRSAQAKWSCQRWGARMEQINNLMRRRIGCLCLILVVVVASLTGLRRVIQRRMAASTARDDVIKRKRLAGILGRTLTLLTAALGTLFTVTTQYRPIGLTHPQGVPFPVRVSVRTASRRDLQPPSTAPRCMPRQRFSVAAHAASGSRKCSLCSSWRNVSASRLATASLLLLV